MLVRIRNISRYLHNMYSYIVGKYNVLIRAVWSTSILFVFVYYNKKYGIASRYSRYLIIGTFAYVTVRHQISNGPRYDVIIVQWSVISVECSVLVRT